jgi:diaminopimelate epimerase
MTFTKMTGAGNDFIVLGDYTEPSLKPETIHLLCDRRYGIGADGLMVIHEPEGIGAEAVGAVAVGDGATGDGAAGDGAAGDGAAGDGAAGDGAAARGTAAAFSVDFYNADGSGGMLCGNGARCALVYAARQRLISYGEAAVFSFAGRNYKGIALASDRARFMLDPRYSTRLEEKVQAGMVTARGRFIDLGSLHFVVDMADLQAQADESGELAEKPWGLSLEQLDVATLGAALRHHPRFAPLGVNVNFCFLIDGRLQVRTFERGVEAETLACGTGSTAAALSYALMGLVSAPVTVVTRSGEELIIDFDDAEKPSWLSLEGPAKVVFQGRI